MPLEQHPGTLCWCGHPLASHANYTRDKIGGCRQYACPCVRWTQDGDPLPIVKLNDLLVGMTVTVQMVGFRAHGVLERIDHNDGTTFLRIRNPENLVLETRVRSDLPALISIDLPWDQPR